MRDRASQSRSLSQRGPIVVKGLKQRWYSIHQPVEWPHTSAVFLSWRSPCSLAFRWKFEGRFCPQFEGWKVHTHKGHREKSTESHEFQGILRVFSGCFHGIFRVFSGCFSLCPFWVCPLDPSKQRRSLEKPLWHEGLLACHDEIVCGEFRIPKTMYRAA